MVRVDNKFHAESKSSYECVKRLLVFLTVILMFIIDLILKLYIGNCRVVR